MVDEHNRKIIHFRWINQCIKKNKIIEDNDQMHLLPLPQRIPVADFGTTLIALTLFDKNDKEVFECLVKLYGFKPHPKPWECTHIVVHK